MNISQKAVFILSSFRFQIGLTMYLELFKRNPESKANFPFLKHLDHDDIEFYDQLKNHAIRVTGVLGMLIRQVRLQFFSHSEMNRFWRFWGSMGFT